MLSHHGKSQIEEIESSIKALCRENDKDKILMLTDSNVEKLIGEFLPDSPKMKVPAGERSKSIEMTRKIWQFLIDKNAIRRSVLVNVGGGMVSDLGGFAAATYKRGISCINVPTTLLAAVDASIGGKTGINFDGLKNEVGVFAMPLGVFPLTSLFEYLPENEWLSGVGEAIKTGLLDSMELFEMTISEDFIEHRKQHVVDEVVRRCEMFKNRIVEEDFKEGGKRKILNLGHTAAHAIEEWKMAHGETIPHGIAVAHGLRIALEKSCKEIGFPEKIYSQYLKVLERYFPPLNMTEAQMAEAEKYMLHDKKNRVFGVPSWVLLRNVGEPVF